MSAQIGLLWEEASRRLRDEISKEDYETWFDAVSLRGIEEDRAVLNVPTDYRRDVIQQSYETPILRILNELAGRTLNMTYQVGRDSITDNPAPILGNLPAEEETPELECSAPLNFRYGFDSFVVGESNRLAFAAAMNVAKEPGKTYNPLFIHGGVGLGKTHILHAIGHYVLEHHPGMKVAYVPIEGFVNEFILSIQENRRSKFQRKLRNLDVLLIDDVHFLAGKESTQEEFFHTFNALHNRHKLIVLTSDRPPKEIPTLEDRLRSRFEWGLITDISFPDLETRAAIVRKKCETEHLDLPEEVAMYVAQRIKYSIRELEGALIKISAHAQWTKVPPSIDMAAKILGKLSIRGEREVTIERIQKKVGDYFRVKMADLLGEDRSRSVTVPRQVAMYLCRELTSHSYPEIGTFFGGKDHTTVLYSVRRIDREINKDEEFHRSIERLKMMICQPD